MLQDSEKENHTVWDEKFKGLLWQLQDAQADKDHPQAQVVNIEIEDLFVLPYFPVCSRANILAGSSNDSSHSSTNTIFVSYTFTRYCERRNWRFSTTWLDLSVRGKLPNQKLRSPKL